MTDHPLIHRLAASLLGHPWTMAMGVLAIVAISIAALPNLRKETGVDVFLDPDLPLRVTLAEVNEHFVNDDILYIGYESEDPFSHRALSLVRKLVDEIEQLKLTQSVTEPVFVAEDVKSLTTLKDLRGSEYTFHTVDLVPDPVPTDKAALNAIRERAKRNPIIFANLLSNDLKAAAIVVRIPDEFNDNQRSEAIALLRQVLNRIEKENVWIRFHLAGEDAIKADLSRLLTKDIGRFIPLAYGVVLILLFVFVRKFYGMILALIMATVSLLASFALLPLTGGTLNNCTAMLPPLIITLSVAIFLHYISELGKNHVSFHADNPPLKTLRELMVPAFIAALTTAIGFASITVSSVPAVRQFGVAASGAILVAFVVVTAMFVVFNRLYKPSSLISEHSFVFSKPFSGALAALAGSVVRGRWPILIVSLMVTIAAAVGIFQIRVDTDLITRFSHQTPIRIATDFVDTRLVGTTNIIVAVHHDEEGHFDKPEALKRIEKLEAFFKNELDVPHVTSVVDYLKIMNREYFNGDQAQYRLPDTEAQSAQLLLLNGDRTLDEYLDESRRGARIVGSCPNLSSSELIDKYQRLDHFAAETFPTSAGYVVKTTGMSKVTAYMTDYIVYSLVISLSITVALILILMFAMFRSVYTGFIAMIPNALPILFIMGTMGWLGVSLDSATVLIATCALGIAVDDTVHFIHHLRERLAEHHDLERAIRETYDTKGPAITWTSIAITLGFATMLASDLSNVRSFGLLMGGAMISALLGDIVILPALILSFRTRLGVQKNSPAKPQA